jgi:hypothetical protein
VLQAVHFDHVRSHGPEFVHRLANFLFPLEALASVPNTAGPEAHQDFLQRVDDVLVNAVRASRQMPRLLPLPAAA